MHGGVCLHRVTLVVAYDRAHMGGVNNIFLLHRLLQ